jgi:hypothetical protein
MARQTQKGRVFGGEVKGVSSPKHKTKQYLLLIGDLDTVTWPGTVPT